jgi:FlaA1/EpsC-like NDP-sugar epimerase
MDRLINYSLGALFPERKSPFHNKFNGRGVEGRRVLVTGAGGSIGSELAERILQAVPSKLLLLDHSEHSLHELSRKIQVEKLGRRADIVLGDVGDDALIECLLAREKPQIIFHAAAFKHVPLLEQNRIAAIENNALATWRLARTAAASGVEQLLLISTDKAANPQSMLGVSKRLAELAVLRWNSSHRRMCALRLGNVAGSSGSVIPLFAEQIAKGEAVTVTDPLVSRYFLTMDEACNAILQLGSAINESGLFVTDMGERVAITALANRMIEAGGGVGTNRSQVKLVGLRPGDKLHEDILSSEELLGAEISRGIRKIITRQFSSTWLDEKFEQVQERTRRRDMDSLLQLLQEMVPEYQPNLKIWSDKSAAAANGSRK